MTATYPPLSRDALLLCRAIDLGHDDTLPGLADELESCGDPRAEGLRGEMPRMHHYGPDYWFGGLAVATLYDRDLPLGVYPSRSAAFLALAEALAAGGM